MPRQTLQLLSGSNPHQSKLQSQASLVNYYLEKSEGGLSEVLAIPTPGMSVFASISGNTVRHLLQYKDALYAVVDANVYSINSSGTATLLGTLGTSSGRVDAVGGADYVMWVDGNEGRYYQISTTTFGTISDVDFIDTATSCTFLDGYFVINDPDATSGSGRWWISDLNNATSWPAYSGTASSDGDALLSVRSDTKYLILFGESTLEYLSGSTSVNEVFIRQKGLNTPVGCCAQYSIARSSKGGFFFLAQTKTGRGQVCYVNTGQVEVISTASIHHEIGSYSTVSDAIGFVYEQSGHEFYVLTFPTEEKTWVFDLQTGSWHRRTSYLPTINPQSPYSRLRAECYAYFNGKHCVGDLISGNVLYLDSTVYTENSSTILREITTPTVYQSQDILAVQNFSVEFEPNIGTESGEGLDPEVKIRVSKDGGFTWSDWYTRSLANLGEYNKAVTVTRFGSGKKFTMQMQLSDPVNAIVVAVTSDVKVPRQY